MNRTVSAGPPAGWGVTMNDDPQHPMIATRHLEVAPVGD